MPKGVSQVNNDRRRKKRANNRFKWKLKENVGEVVSKNELVTSCLNVDGLSYDSFVDVCDFVDQTSPDVVFLLETKRREEHLGFDISLSGYDVFEVKRSDTEGHKGGGGIACYTKRTEGLNFERHRPEVPAQLDYVNYERVWIKVSSPKCKTAILSVYGGCQYPDNRNADWNEGIYLVLSNEVQQLRAEGYRIAFCGDFNAHIGSVPGQGVPGNNPDINENGLKFMDFLDSCALKHINGDTLHCKGLWTWQRGSYRSVIDYAGISEEHLASVVSMTVDDGGLHPAGSDHNWVTLVLKDSFRRKILRPGNRQKKKWDIKEDQDWDFFQSEVSRSLPSYHEASSMDVNELATTVSQALRAGGESAIGYKAVKPRTSYLSRSLPIHIVVELEKKRLLERKWKSLVKLDRSQVSPQELLDAEVLYSEQKQKCAKLLYSYKKDKDKKILENSSSFWSAVSGKVKQSAEIVSVQAASGIMKCDPEDVKLEVENHLQQVFSGSLHPIEDDDDLEEIEENFIPSSYSDNTYAVNSVPLLPASGDSDLLESDPDRWLGRRFAAKEIQKVAKSLNNNKACGWDSLPSEFIKYGPHQLFVILALLFNKMRDTNSFPAGWNKGKVTLVHKRGSRSVLGNYRPITVLISLAGLYSRVLNERLTSVVETHNLLGEIQGGFRKNRGCADNTFILNTLCWKARSQHRKLHMAFLDITKGGLITFSCSNSSILILKSPGTSSNS